MQDLKTAGDIKPEHIVHRAPDHDGGTVLVVETADGWQWFRCDAAGSVTSASTDVHGAPWTCLDAGLIHALPTVSE